MTQLLQTPADLPEPSNDGAADHLLGMPFPEIALPATTGGVINIPKFGTGPVVVFAYPRTGVPGEPLPEGWDEIAGARGCTPQNCAFRDLNAEFESQGVKVVGLSTNPPTYQSEMADRLHLPYPVLSDADLLLTRALRLPTFEINGMVLLRRLTMLVSNGLVVNLHYPVFPPGDSAAAALSMVQKFFASGDAR